MAGDATGALMASADRLTIACWFVGGLVSAIVRQMRAPPGRDRVETPEIRETHRFPKPPGVAGR